MPIVDLIPGWARHAVGAVLPPAWREALREEVVRRYYVPSNITRETGVHRFMRRSFTARNPTLYHLDLHITDHCNLNCKGCETYSSLSSPHFADYATFDRDLGRLSALFETIEEIYLMGGEPLLHPDLAQFVACARRHFPQSRVVVLTNAILATRMPADLLHTIRVTKTTLLCDRYPIRIDAEAIDQMGTDSGVRIEWTPPVTEFSKVPIEPAASCNARRSHARCRNVANCAIVREGRLYPCQRAAFADILVESFGLPSLADGPRDSIELASSLTGDKAISFLMKPIPWCAHCDFDARTDYPWTRTRRDPSEWLAQAPPTMLDQSESRDERSARGLR